MSLDVSSYEEGVQPRTGSLARSTSSTSSTPARQHHHHSYERQQHNLHTTSSSNSTTSSPGESRRYQYVPYSASQPTPVHDEYGSQTSLPNRGGRSQYIGFTSQGIAVQRLNSNMPGSRSPQNGQSPPRRQSPHNSIDQRQHALNDSYQSAGQQQRQQRQQGYTIAERQARSSSLKANTRHHMVDRYEEFSDARHQFNNHVTAPYRASSSSSENSPQGSPLRSSPRGPNQILARTGHQRSPTNYSRYQHQQQAKQLLQQVAVDNIQEDLHEIQSRKCKHSGGRNKKLDAESLYRSASRNTFLTTDSNVPRRVSSSDSFSFASSIKCCVGLQPKKKKSSRRAVAYHHPQPKIIEKEKPTNGTSDNWVSLAAVKSQNSQRAYRNSPSQSTVSCPYIMQTPPIRNNGRASKHSSGYASEMETSSCNIMMEEDDFESESDLSDFEFARATAGSRGKSANSMMMKLAKKFSKKNLPITREDVDANSVGGDTLEKAWQMKQRSNSVSNLDTLEGLGPRSQSMEHLGPMSVNNGRSGSVGTSTPQGSPRMRRSGSRGKLNRRSTEVDSDGSVTSLLYRTGSKGLAGDTSESLFEAIEQGNYEAVAALIDARIITKFNSLNEDEFLAVDLSVMLGHHNIAQLLLKIGAKDSPKFCRDPSSRRSRITALISEAERDLYRLKEKFTSLSASSGVKDVEKRYKRGERRLHLYRHMLRNYDMADVPGAPTNVQLHITSGRSLMVTFSKSEHNNNATVTRYKIEWCTSEEFKPVVGDFVMTDLRSMEYIIPDLDNGEKYYVRVSAYNMKGFGPTSNSSPPCAVPSSWHDSNNSSPRYQGCTDSIHLVSAQFGMMLRNYPVPPPDENTDASGVPVSTSSKPKSSKKPNALTRMFTSSAKFHKLLKPGVFLASLVYSEDTKILVTTDDSIPIVEVSESTLSSIGSDFVWLAQLACTWEQVPLMCDVSDSYTSSPAVQFRNKLLHAVLDLQNAMSLSDLGLLHPVPYKDSHGAIVFVIVQYTNETKSVASGNSSLKWSDLSKLWKRRATPTRTTGLEAFPVPDQIVLDAQEIIAHHYTSIRPLEKGLYLGYLKARSSVASMKVICSREYPNVLPHFKIRENPNLSKEEWEWLKSLQSPKDSPPPLYSNPQHLQNSLLSSILLFLKNLGFNKEQTDTHQLYVHEAIELNEGTTILLVLPPPDHVCTAPGSSDHFADMPDFVALPINTFEIMQLYTYQRSFMTKFSLLYARLEVELLASHQRLREAFSKAEVTEAKEKQALLEDYNSRTDQVWKKMRWIEDAVQKGRDHEAGCDTLPVSLVRQTIEVQMKEVARLQQEAKRKEEEAPPIPLHRNKGPDGVVADEPSNGYLRVIPTYRTGLTKGTSVKLYIENITTTVEVIGLVVNQVAKATGSASIVDFSDFYLVASIGQREWVLKPDYRPLQLQTHPTETGNKVFLLLKRRSEENQLNQMVTSV